MSDFLGADQGALRNVDVGVAGHGEDAVVAVRFDWESGKSMMFHFAPSVADDLCEMMKQATLHARLGGNPSMN